MQTVVITDGEQRASLAIVRSLGAAGYRCVVTSESGHSLAGASRYARRDVAVADPAERPSDYAHAIAAVARSEAAELVLPVTEGSLLALLPVRERLGAHVPFPDLAAVRAISDKRRVLEAAASVGIRTPRQQVIPRRGDAWDVGTTFPIVLKPHRSVYDAPDGTRGKVGVSWAQNGEELAARLGDYPDAAYPILVQEAVSGPGIGIFVLLHEGRLLAQFAHRRMREKPPSGGVSVLRQSEPMDGELLQRSVALLNGFNWSGVAMVEYKRDVRTGEAVLMEINGRFWGSLQLAVDAGVDFPRLLADVSLGVPVDAVDDYRFVRSRWFWGDVDHVIARWREPNASQAEGWHAVSGWLRAFGPGYRSEVFRWTDPRPFARETATWVASLARD